MAEADRDGSGRLVLDKPRWSQDTFNGRAKHFFNATNPLNLLTTNQQLDAAKLLIEQYKLAIEPAGTTEEKVWSAKYLYDSAFHPETREKQMLIGRMSAQVPMNMTITGAMMTFYKTNTAVIFWQWLNQSFNAIVNYTNRSGDTPIPTNTLLKAYLSATGAALGVGLGLNAMVKTLPPIVGRFVPFACVASANCVNIPLMRQREIIDGIPVFDENGNRLGESKIAASRAVQMTVFSRVVMAMPGMSIPPLVMSRLEEKPFMKRMPWLASPIQIGLVGFILCFATPLCCAIFPQTSSLDVDKLEPELQESIGTKAQRVYFNKGL